jgi:uncharacterized alpha-E superfamily protein
MSTQREILEYGKSKINQWRGMLEELEVQLALGKAEAKDVLKEEKKNISKFISKQKTQFKKAEEKMMEDRISLLRKLYDLEAMLRMEEPKSKRIYDSRRKQTMKVIHEIEYLIRLVDKEAPVSILAKMDELKESLDNYRIALALSEFATKDKVNASQNILLKRLEEVGTFLDRENSVKGKGIQHFMDEISESFDHLKKAFSEII